ncbi:hypothetical protein HU749_006740 [Pseudomonas ogarae]|uniref:hypothetical protein n=1 Tax=Pseudomonas ogarae (strain DSM 112162 / CECT 30235 / F113) TaxID=1114970 RepID=UPI001647BE62|nr:hypothetical protein [Pseudomonas zarinae]QXH96078.1 hypothetical protein HU749_006740 [Pseudomonas zarinae]
MKLELKRYDVELPDNVNLALVITGDISDGGQRHTGFVVKDFFGDVWLFHLASNNVYIKSIFTSRYHYLLVPSLEPETELVIISFLAVLYGVTEGKVPYSIGWDEKQYFDSGGGLVMDNPGDGFTCATFVLESFKRYGMDMVARETWPLSPEDSAWQNKIIKLLDLSPEQFLAQVEKVGKYPRFHPEQALGAAHHFTNFRLPYSVVHPAGEEVVAEMARLSA